MIAPVSGSPSLQHLAAAPAAQAKPQPEVAERGPDHDGDADDGRGKNVNLLA